MERLSCLSNVVGGLEVDARVSSCSFSDNFHVDITGWGIVFLFPIMTCIVRKNKQEIITILFEDFN